MTIEHIVMPQLGESVTEGTIERWLVKEGDLVKKYDPIAEVTTDKVNADIPSSFDGVIQAFLVEEGDTHPVGTAVCAIKVEQTQVTSNISPTLQNVSPNKKVDVEKPKEKSLPQKQPKQNGRYSPAVLTLAAQHEIDLSDIQGSGLGGRITRKDIEKFIETGKSSYVVQEETTVAHTKSLDKTDDHVVTTSSIEMTPQLDKEIAVTGVRKAIAQNMVKAKTEIPHAWMMVEVDVTKLVQARNQLKEAFLQKEGFPLTYFAYFMKAVALGLKQYPMMNAIWDTDTIVQKKEINLSIAVATDDALFVPVIHQVDEKTIKGIAREIYELANLTRAGKLKMSHMQGGTFTVNNTGTFGSVQSAGIINAPQAAILQIESIVKRPVIVQDNMIAVRDMVNLCLSLDHRILDGLICGKFLQYVKNLLESDDFYKMSVY
jgi:2-oxoisovalerate dehydrogenase E2 component (dihydrolipoyl transacylase)